MPCLVGSLTTQPLLRRPRLNTPLLPQNAATQLHVLHGCGPGPLLQAGRHGQQRYPHAHRVPGAVSCSGHGAREEEPAGRMAGVGRGHVVVMEELAAATVARVIGTPRHGPAVEPTLLLQASRLTLTPTTAHSCWLRRCWVSLTRTRTACWRAARSKCCSPSWASLQSCCCPSPTSSN